MGLLWELGYFAEQNQNIIRAVLVSSGFSDVTLGVKGRDHSPVWREGF